MTYGLGRRCARALGVIAAAVLLASLSACASTSSWTEVSKDCVAEHEFETIEPGKLIVAKSDPSDRSALNGESLAGMEGDLVRLIAKRNCFAVETVRISDGESPLPAVQNGEADLALGFWHRGGVESIEARVSEPIVVDASGAGDETGGAETGGAESSARLSWPMSAENKSLAIAIDEEISELRENGMIARLLEKWGLDPEQADLEAQLG